MQIEVLTQSAIKLQGEKTIYFDPYNIKDDYHDADYIFITHDHYDHYDEKSIEKVKKDTTKIIVPKCLETKKHDLVVEPNNSYKIDNISFDTIPSYNLGKSFHTKEMNYVGYKILLDGLYYYIMGDTDRTEEADQVKCDVCFVPIGGTYTMDVQEAADYINYIKPTTVIPIHYGSIVGDMQLGNDFSKLIEKNIKVLLLMKER